MPPSEDLFQVLIRKYFDKNNIREVNYVQFCKDIDKPEDIFVSYEPKHPKAETDFAPGQLRDAGCTFFDGKTSDLNLIENRYLKKRIEIANDPSDVELRIQAAVVMKRVRIEEFFLDFDKLRKGKVTVN